jgi:hypothetical protein
MTSPGFYERSCRWPGGPADPGTADSSACTAGVDALEVSVLVLTMLDDDESVLAAMPVAAQHGQLERRERLPAGRALRWLEPELAPYGGTAAVGTTTPPSSCSSTTRTSSCCPWATRLEACQ